MLLDVQAERAELVDGLCFQGHTASKKFLTNFYDLPNDFPSRGALRWVSHTRFDQWRHARRGGASAGLGTSASRRDEFFKTSPQQRRSIMKRELEGLLIVAQIGRASCRERV